MFCSVDSKTSALYWHEPTTLSLRRRHARWHGLPSCKLTRADATAVCRTAGSALLFVLGLQVLPGTRTKCHNTSERQRHCCLGGLWPYKLIINEKKLKREINSWATWLQMQVGVAVSSLQDNTRRPLQSRPPQGQAQLFFFCFVFISQRTSEWITANSSYSPAKWLLFNR